MKHLVKHVGLFLSCLFIGLQANSQTSLYHPFPDSSATWNFEVKVPLCWPGKEYYSIYMKGDTLFGNLTYHKLYKPYIDVSNRGVCGARLQTLGYLGAVRQDIAQKKVYFKCKTCTTETLLYNFNLQTNDTIRGVLQDNSVVVTVGKIDSVLVGNTYRKRWNLSNTAGAAIVEGIGSSYGLINALKNLQLDPDAIKLSCFNQNSTTLLSSTSGPCALILGVDNRPETHSGIRLYPNPAAEKLFITLPANGSYELKILNCYGQKMLEAKPNNETTEIDVSSLPVGIYMLSIGQGTQTLTQKLIKTN